MVDETSKLKGEINFMKKSLKMSLIGTVLLSISGVCHAYTNSSPPELPREAADTLQTLIDQGHISVNPTTGQLTVESSVLEILRQNDHLGSDILTPLTSHECTGADR